MAVLSQYDMAAATASTVAGNVTAGDLTNSNLYSFTVNVMDYEYVSEPVLYTAPQNSSTVIADAVTNNCYFYFTIAPAGGYELDLTSLTFDIAKGGATTTRGYGVFTSADAYATTIGTADVATLRANWTSVNIDLTGAAFQNLTSTLTFRIYIYSGATTRSVELDTVTVNGAVVATATGCPRQSMYLARKRNE